MIRIVYFLMTCLMIYCANANASQAAHIFPTLDTWEVLLAATFVVMSYSMVVLYGILTINPKAFKF